MEGRELKRHTKALGEYSEIVIAGRLLQAGFYVLKPFGDSLRYDLVIEDADGKFWKVQCKTAWLQDKGGIKVIKFLTTSRHDNDSGGRYNHARRGYHGEIDFFAVYSPDLDKVYIIPIDHANTSEMTLRLIMPKGRNQYGIKMAADYEL
ncbi:MAG TPA: group I intron-associated PD-(D/E)XK endonuclease [Ktedonobacteraceae bacterium]